MKVCVISDTHIPDRYGNIPAAAAKALKECDLLIHAGDFTSVEYFKMLKAANDLKAVLGNLDAPELRDHLKEKETFTLGKFKVGLMHGFGSAANVFENVRRSFDDSYDLVIFGHSHTSLKETIGKTLFFNPGSPTDKIFATSNSYGLIEVNDTLKATIITL